MQICVNPSSPSSPSKSFTGLSFLGLKTNHLTHSRKHCVAWPLLTSSASSLPHLSSVSRPQEHCLSSCSSHVLGFFSPEVTSLCLECSADSMLPVLQPLRSPWRCHFLTGASLNFHKDKIPKEGPLRVSPTPPHIRSLIFICVIIWLMFILTA